MTARCRALPALPLAVLLSQLPASLCYHPFSGATATRILRRPARSDRGDGERSSVLLLRNGVEGIQDVQLETVAVDEWLKSKDRSLLAFGTYAGDFNTFEYMQCLRHYLPELRGDGCGVEQFAVVVSATPRGGRIVADLLDLPARREDEEGHVEVWVDNTGSLARRFNVSRGWLPDAASVPPWVKLAGMMPWGLGAPETFGAILEGYAGVHPGSGGSRADLEERRRRYSWIQDAFAVGQRHGRWPDSIVDVDPTTGQVLRSKFDDFWFGTGPSWPLRPLEKATLRLQTMLGITLRHWGDVMPDSEALRHGVLTQLGGCAVFCDGGRRSVFEHRDAGCCATVDFEDMIRALKSQKETTELPSHR
jgi:hypothetical protein